MIALVVKGKKPMCLNDILLASSLKFNFALQEPSERLLETFDNETVSFYFSGILFVSHILYVT